MMDPSRGLSIGLLIGGPVKKLKYERPRRTTAVEHRVLGDEALHASVFSYSPLYCHLTAQYCRTPRLQVKMLAPEGTGS